jgi:hypothetical protein
VVCTPGINVIGRDNDAIDVGANDTTGFASDGWLRSAKFAMGFARLSEDAGAVVGVVAMEKPPVGLTPVRLTDGAVKPSPMYM